MRGIAWRDAVRKGASAYGELARGNQRGESEGAGHLVPMPNCMLSGREKRGEEGRRGEGGGRVGPRDENKGRSVGDSISNHRGESGIGRIGTISRNKHAVFCNEGQDTAGQAAERRNSISERRFIL